MKRRYLFTLEITPLDVGTTYDELPSHLTLMSRFFSELGPEQITAAVYPLFAASRPIELHFGDVIELGSKKLLVHTVNHLDVLASLHESLRTLLDSIIVEYEYPQFMGENHKPHVTKREGALFDAGSPKVTTAAYLIEIVDGKRVVRSKLDLTG